MDSPFYQSISRAADIQKYIQQIERKKQYNRDYYHSKVKPKRENQKQEIDVLRERNIILENYVKQTEGQSKEDPIIVNELKRQIQTLNDKNFDLNQQIDRLQHDNNTLRQALEVARQRNYELMMQKADDILPNIQNLTLNS